MARYLVIANQTATSEHLMERLREIAERDAGAAFTLVVPETHVTHLLVCDEGESREYAQRQLAAAEGAIRDAGLPLERASIGNASPLTAIEDALRSGPRGFDAIVLSTLPPGRSRWLAMDAHGRAERFGLPVVHVMEGAEATRFAMPPIPPSPPRESAGARPGLAERASGRLWAIVAAMGIYIVLSTLLAVAVDQRFFIADLVAVAFFAALLLGIRYVERPRPR